MATDTSSVGNTVPCPDPSAHDHKNRLSEQASTAALYVTHPERATEVRGMEKEHPLGPDGKLSSKSAAASLKYARAQDLPSFPSHGHGADSASKAAMLAKDYKMKELWQPELSAAGSRAALLAHDKGGKLDLWEPKASAEGNSAAGMAMRNKTLSPQLDYGYTPDGKNRALLAATMSVNKGRQRAESTPAPVHPAYPDSKNASHNALNAATVSHRSSTKPTSSDGWDSEANQAARITHLGNRMDKAMFTEHPPVEIEREEAKHNAALRASAISMAKQLYDQQNQAGSPTPETNIAGAGAGTAHARNPSAAQPTDLKQEAMKYINLQEAAHKLAAERLAKVDKNFENARYREYYGYGGEEKPKRISSRFSLRAGRGRASSEADADLEDSDDEGQARRIRSQMSQLNSGLNSVDNKKQQDDRARLLAAAEKRVSDRMHNMDEKVFLETGKVPPAMMEEWEEKARKRAQEERAEKAQYPGKTHIGGGKYMDQSEIEAIAAARLKPTLEEINDTAEKKRARDEEIRLEKEEQERMKREEKARNREEKEEQKRVKNEEKAAAKKEKDEAKARKDEEKRVAKEDKRKSRDIKREEAAEVAGAAAAGATLGEVADKVKDEHETEPTAQTGVEKHRSALSRLKERFKRSDKKGADAEDEVADAPHTSAHTGTGEVAAGTAVGTVGGAAVGATLAETASPPGAIDPQQAAHAVEVDEEDDDDDFFEPAQTSQEEKTLPTILAGGVAGTTAGDLASEPAPATQSAAADRSDLGTQPTLLEPPKAQRPHFEQTSSLSGLYADEEIPRAGKPDLERHISQIPDLSEDEDEDSDWEEGELERPVAGLEYGQAREPEHQLAAAPVIAERVIAAPVVSAPTETIPPSADRHLEEPISPLEDEPVHPWTAIASAPVESTSAAAEPPVVPQGPSANEMAEPKTLTGASVAGPSAVGAVAGPAATDEHHDHHDHQHNKLHKEPPKKVQEEIKAAEIKAGKTTHPSISTPASEYLRKTSIDNDARPSSGIEENEKERKGIRGLFNKLRSKPSRSENKYPEFKPASETKTVPHETASKPVPTNAAATGAGVPASEAAAAPAVTSSATDSATAATKPSALSKEEHVGTDGAIGDSAHVSGITGNPRPTSVSSFSRGDTTAHRDLDDVSSSGADEEDVKRGRGGRLARKLGLTKGGKGKEPAGEHQASRTDQESFEEARDHFDESKAPKPAFAGQAKNESPIRGTRFQEEL